MNELDESPEGNSDYGTWRDHLDKPESRYYEHANRMLNRWLRQTQKERRAKRIQDKESLGDSSQ